MSKNQFYEYIEKIRDYDSKFNDLCEVLGSNLDHCFVNDMINDMGLMLIETVNPDLESTHKDYFVETFWNKIVFSFDRHCYETFYDELVKGKAAEPIG